MQTIPFFKSFFDEVKVHAEWQELLLTVENTGWHREENVAVHTTMTINYYLEHFAPHRTERQRMLALMALLFHDFGKPESETTIQREGKPYHQYINHEEESAKMMRKFFEDKPEMCGWFFAQGYSFVDIDAIYFIIDRHLPYGLVKKDKIAKLHAQIDEHLGEDAEVFYDVLRSDSNGRISDTHEENLYRVEEWITKFKAAK